MNKDSRLNQNYKQWHQFRLDLNNLNSWLDEAEALLSAQEADSPAGDLEGMIRRHRVSLGDVSKRTVGTVISDWNTKDG